MKKALVVLLALTCLSAAVFADVNPLAITGSLETGVAFVIPHSGPGIARLYDNDSGNAARLLLGINFTSPDGNWGVITRLDAEGLVGNNSAEGKSGSTIAGFDRALLWGNVVPGLLTLKGGVLDEEAYATENEGWGNFTDNAVGMEVVVKPTAGLQVSYFLPVANATDYTVGGAPLLFNASNWAGSGSMNDAFAASTFALAYAMPNMANIVLGYRNGTGTATGVDQKTGYFWGGFSLKAVPNVLARLEVQAVNLGAANGVAGYGALEEGAYTIGAAGAGQIVPDIVIIEDILSGSGNKVLYTIRPSVTYNLGMAVVGIGFDYTTDAGYNWGVDNLGTIAPKSFTKYVTGWDVWPNVSIPFGKNQVNVALVYGQGDTSNSSTTSTAIFIDYRVFLP